MFQTWEIILPDSEYLNYCNVLKKFYLIKYKENPKSLKVKESTKECDKEKWVNINIISICIEVCPDYDSSLMYA